MQLKSDYTVKLKSHSVSLRTVTLTVLLGVLFLITHVPKLGVDEVNPDAVNWHWRSEQYVDAIKSKDFRRTYQYYHPGVTLMVLTGIPVEISKKTLGLPSYDKDTFEIFHFVAKYSINVVLLFLTVLIVFLLSKISNFKVAYLTGLFLAIDPFFLGNSRLLHLDSLLSLFTLLSLLCFILYSSNKKLVFLVFTGLFLGLAFWTKNVSVLTSFVVLLLSFWFKFTGKFSLKDIAKVFLVLTVSLLAVGYAILPALWVDPIRVFTKMYKGSESVIELGHSEKFFGVISDNPGPLYYPVVFGYKLSPFVLILFLLSTAFVIKDLVRARFDITKTRFPWIYQLLAFSIFYFAAIEVAPKKIDRYLLPLFPIVYILASISLVSLISKIKNLIFLGTVVVAFIVISVIPIISYFPYYFIYNSPLFGGLPVAERVIGQKSFGVGIFEAREFVLENYGEVKLGFIDRKPMSAIYPGSKVFDALVYGSKSYDVLILDSDEEIPRKAVKVFVYDKSLQIQGINFWNFYVKKVE